MARSYSFSLTACLNAGIILAGLVLARAEGPAPVVVMLGDSLTAGYGLEGDQALPVKLEETLRKQGYDIEIRNSGISGDTTAGGRERIEWSIGEDADAVIVARDPAYGNGKKSRLHHHSAQGAGRADCSGRHAGAPQLWP